MATKTGPECSINWKQVAAFRLRRHSLLQRSRTDIAAISRDVCGIQAQLMASAEIALAVRASRLACADVRSALWKDRTLVRIFAMRQTLHLLPSSDFSIYMSALRSSRMNTLLRIMSKLGVTRGQVDAMNQAIVNALSAGPLTKTELLDRIKGVLTKGLKAWMELSWTVFRPAIIEGLICYGPDRGREGTFVRVDQWLPRQKPVDENKAKQILFRCCLAAYGPATVRDLAKWSGVPMSEAKEVWTSLAKELAEVSVEGQAAWILHGDLKELKAAGFDAPVVRLLPHFDPYMLAHADKGHLVELPYYKRVYRNQGWLSPVILLNGRVAGVWQYQRGGRTFSVTVEPFENWPKALRGKIHGQIEEEAANIARFLGLELAAISYSG